MPQLYTWDVFRGEAPKYAPRHLPAGYARQAFNCKLFDGKLKPWFKMSDVFTLTKTGTIQSIFPLRDTNDTKYWLHWAEVVDVAYAKNAADTTDRVAFTGYGAPKQTNYALATTGVGTNYPLDYWRLGVPAPASACSVASGGGGSGVARDRSYLITFIHEWADGKTEESAPGTASAIISAKSGETINLSSIPRWIITPTSITRSGSTATVTIPAGRTNWFGDKDRATIAGAAEAEYNGTYEITRVDDTHFTYTVSGTPATPATGTITVKSNHNVTKKRVYRTVVGNAGAFFRYVTELNESDTTYADSSSDAALALNDAIPSFNPNTLVTWDMPPLDLHSIIDIGNGILAGLSGNVVCFSEPYYYHAWPEAYRRTLPYTGVGTGIIGTTLVIPTKGNPITYTGTHPASMAESKLTRINHGCLSKRGIVSMGWAVQWPAKEGLASVGPGSQVLETSPWFDRETWALVYPDTMRSFQFNDRYFGAYQSGTSGGNPVGGAIIIDRENNIGGVGTTNYYFAGGYFDVRSGALYLIHDGKVKQWDADQSQRDLMNWRSGQVIMPAPKNMGAARIEAEFQYTAEEVAAINAQAAAAQAANLALLNDSDLDGPLNTWMLNEAQFNANDEDFQDVPDALDNPALTFQLYIDSVLKFSKSISATGTFKLPEGYRANNFDFLISGNGTVHRVQVAENMLALKMK